MNKTLIRITLLIFLTGAIICAQDFRYLGLAGSRITSLKTGYGIIAAGTNSEGVFWQTLPAAGISAWNLIEVDSAHVRTVYPHKSGPLGWSIGIGCQPNLNDSGFIYCSFLGGAPMPMNNGIDAAFTEAVTGLDGFPDPTVCGETFALGGRKLYRRNFGDTTWHTVRELSIEGNFAALKAREEFQYVLAGGAEGFAGMLLIRSSDKGDSWEDLAPLCMVADLDFWGGAKQKIFVTDMMKIKRSLDSGLNWDVVFQTDSLMILNISLSPDGGRIYAIANTIWYGLPRVYFFFSDDDGNNWEKLQLPVYDIIAAMDVDNTGDIYIASVSSGVFRLRAPVVSVEENRTIDPPADLKLFQNYPNPFNPTTVIEYEIPSAGNVRLEVFDLLGKKITDIINEERTAGRHSVKFDAGDLPAGIYFYRLTSNNLSAAKKLILLK